MASSSRALKTLHDLHLRLKDVQDELSRGPRLIQSRTSTVQKKQAELDAARDKLKQMKLTADQKSLQLKTNEAKIAELRTKLNIAASNREYEILTGQIEADTMANSVLEDEILEALTRVDQIQVDVRQAEQAVQVAQEQLKKTNEEVAASEPGLKEREAALQTNVAAAEKFLPADIAPQYRRTVQAFGAEALSAVEDKVCTCCYVQVTAQRMVELRMGKLMFCQCGRLLYLPSEE